MNKIVTRIWSFVAVVGILFSCTPDNYDLGKIDISPNELVEGIAYTVEHDKENPNIVYLTSLLGSKYTPLWEHPQGRSQEQKVTLKMPFEGTYEVTFGVETRGGIVYGEPVTFKIDNFYAEFVSDELWTLISGGVGNSKTWYLDLDEEGVSRYFKGPVYFYGLKHDWYSITEGQKLEGDNADVYIWEADYPGNSWIMDTADFGSMTFDLIGAANVTVVQNTIPSRGTEKGVFMIDTDNYTMTFTDASMLHNIGHETAVDSWTSVKILSMTENTMQLGVFRTDDPCILSYNFISKDYYENWVPGNGGEEEEPELPDGWENDISQTVSYSIKWVLSPDNPFDWCNLDGTRMNGWNSIEEYADWTGMNASVPATYEGLSITMNSQDKTVVFITPDGTEQNGTYTLDAKGIYTFSHVTPYWEIVNGFIFTTTEENQWRIMSIEKNAMGEVSGMWVGKKESDKAEYFAYHLIPEADDSGSSNPMQAWKKALVNKTFVPDINYFADWVSLTWSGGWTAEEDLYSGPDFTSSDWFWNEEVYTACLASSIRFYLDGDIIKADAVDDGIAKSGITVDIDTEASTLTFSEAPFTYSWIFTNNGDGKGPWMFGSRDGTNLGNVDTNGIYLGFVSGDNEITMVHLILD